MERDRLVVAIDHPDVGMKLNWVYVNLSHDDLINKAVGIVIGVWEWDDATMEEYHKDIEFFLLDPDLWKNVGKRIKWPDTKDVSQEVEDAITRCKLSVYRTMKMHWTHARVMAYAKRSEAHREEALNVTG